MAIFPIVELESTIQIGDKTRISSVDSFTQNEAAITLVEINPDVGGAQDEWFDVGLNARNWFLDWVYSDGSSRTASVATRITTDGAPITTTKTIEVITADDDMLFSDDQDILQYEPQLLDYVRKGRSSFLDYHRGTQFLILDYLNDQNQRDIEGNRFTKEDVIDVLEVKKWSTYWTMARIFESISNAIDDVFAQKAERYMGMAEEARSKGVLRLDIDGDGTLEKSENLQFQSRTLVRN